MSQRPADSAARAILTSGHRSAVVSAPRLVPGTVVVAALLATGRWGSYLGLPGHGLYLTEIMIAVSLVWTLARYHSLLRVPSRSELVSHLRPLLPLVALVTWAVLRSVNGLTSADGARDLAPYAYLVLAGCALLPRDRAAARRSLHVLVGALLVHSVWLTLSVFVPAAPGSMPELGGAIRVLEIRADFDGAVVAVLAGLALHQLVGERRRWPAVALVVVVMWSMVLVLELPNRAALLALVLAVALAVAMSADNLLDVWRGHRKAVVLGAVVLLAGAVVLVPQSNTYKRLSGDPRYAYNDPTGTMDARKRAWTAVLDYVDAQPSRVAVGVGMGPNFLLDSGASQNYDGQVVVTDPRPVRQPHNFVINTYARLGVVGVALLGWLLAALAVAGARVVRHVSRSRGAADPIDVVSVLLPGALLMVAMLGVILESPFGAVPFGWAAGWLLVRAHGLRRVKAPAEPAEALRA